MTRYQKCVTCGTMFATARSNARFCSPRCRKVASRAKKKKSTVIGRMTAGQRSTLEVLECHDLDTAAQVVAFIKEHPNDLSDFMSILNAAIVAGMASERRHQEHQAEGGPVPMRRRAKTDQAQTGHTSVTETREQARRWLKNNPSKPKNNRFERYRRQFMDDDTDRG